MLTLKTVFFFFFYLPLFFLCFFSGLTGPYTVSYTGRPKHETPTGPNGQMPMFMGVDFSAVLLLIGGGGGDE